MPMPSASLPEMMLRRGRACRRSCCRRRPLMQHAVAAVAQGRGAGGVGADEVALHQVAGRPGLEIRRRCAVARDDVAGARCRTADRVVVDTPSTTTPTPIGPGPVPAASVPMKLPAIRLPARGLMPTTPDRVARDDVPRAGAVPPIVLSGPVIEHAPCVARAPSRGVGAEEVARDRVARRIRTIESIRFRSG